MVKKGIMALGRARWLIRLALLIVVPLSTLPGLWRAAEGDGRFRGDESGWMTSADYYTRLVGGEAAGVWDPQPEFGAWGAMTPTLGKLLLGLALPPGPPIRVFYRFDAPYEWNEANGRVPPRGALIRVRKASVLAGVATLILLGLLAERWRGLGVAIGAQLLLALNSLFRGLSTLATPDSLAAAMALAGSLVCLLALDRYRAPRLLIAATAGALAGLGAAVKLNYATSVLLLPRTLLLALPLGRGEGREPDSRRGGGRAQLLTLLRASIVAALAAGMIHLAADPYLWHPEARPGFWRPGDPAWQTTMPGRLAVRVADWRRLIARQSEGEWQLPEGPRGGIARFGILLGTFATGAARGVPLDGPLAAVGLASLGWAVARRRPRATSDAAVGAFVVTQGLLALLLIPLRFGRYFAPPLVPLALLTAEGGRLLIVALARVVRRRRESTPGRSLTS
jgi:4-amino-4-deoxy-L-arabinose transferase-like glycosyltransferase